MGTGAKILFVLENGFLHYFVHRDWDLIGEELWPFLRQLSDEQWDKLEEKLRNVKEYVQSFVM